MSDLGWVKPVSIASIVAITIITLTSDKIAILAEIYNFALKYDAHGWAILSLIFFALMNQYLAIGMPDRAKNLKEAQRNLNETNDALKNSLASWKNFVTANVRIGNSTSTQNAWVVLYWAAQNQKALQEIADTYKEEIKKGQ